MQDHSQPACTTGMCLSAAYFTLSRFGLSLRQTKTDTFGDKISSYVPPTVVSEDCDTDRTYFRTKHRHRLRDMQ